LFDITIGERQAQQMHDEDVKRRIEELVQKHRDEIVETLVKLVGFKTVSGAADEPGRELYYREIGRCLQYMEQECRKLQLEWRNHGNMVAVASDGYNGPFIAFPVHIDVVPPGEGWTHPPFSGKIENDEVWGRGCQDNKGAAAACLWALGIAKMIGLPNARGARVIVGTIEEAGDWADLDTYFRSEPEPEFALVPDASFPVVNGEKGVVNLEVRVEVSGAEPAGDAGTYVLKNARAGERANIVPALAELRFQGVEGCKMAQVEREVERFVKGNPLARAEVKEAAPGSHDVIVTFRGTTAHGSRPEKGHNAALDMLLYMSQSAFVSDDEAETAEFLYKAARDTDGSGLNVAETDPRLGPTSVSLGVLEWRTGNVRAILNIRPTLGFSWSEVQRRATAVVRDFADEIGFQASVSLPTKPWNAIYADPEEYPELIGALQDAYTTYTGRKGDLITMCGTTYAKAFPRALCFGPTDPADEPDLAHQVDERVKIEHLLRNVKIFAYTIIRLCCV
jgi:succinyl-diaminopimelate desuccinylase